MTVIIFALLASDVFTQYKDNVDPDISITRPLGHGCIDDIQRGRQR